MIPRYVREVVLLATQKFTSTWTMDNRMLAPTAEMYISWTQMLLNTSLLRLNYGGS